MIHDWRRVALPGPSRQLRADRATRRQLDRAPRLRSKFVAGAARDARRHNQSRLKIEGRRHVVKTTQRGIVAGQAAERLQTTKICIHSNHGYDVQGSSGGDRVVC